MRRPVVLSVAGSDPSGGAGFQVDLQVMAVHGVHGAAVPTLLTVQDSRGVREVQPLEVGFFRRSLEVVLSDLRPEAVKVGALGSSEIVLALAGALEDYAGALVVDPIALSSSGAPFLDEPGLEAMRERLIPRASLVTPNLAEAALLLEHDDAARGDVEVLARALFARFGAPVLVKGGHAEGAESKDVLFDVEGALALRAPRLEGPSPHGTGCALSTAIACGLAQGLPLRAAASAAKRFVYTAIEGASSLGEGARFLRLGCGRGAA